MTGPVVIVSCVIGTRPEAIKMAPVVLNLREDPRFKTQIIATGQHTDMLHQALAYFGLRADVDLGIMKQKQSLDYITTAVLGGVGKVLDEMHPNVVLVHGDTTTTFSAALASFYRKIPVGHVEAGLRSGNIYKPFPEEMNRLLTDRLSSLWFAPTEGARDNLLREGIAGERIWVTGNTVIDALLLTLDRIRRKECPLMVEDLVRALPEDSRLLLLTAHRRESWGAPMRRICLAVRKIVEEYPDLWALVPMHKNPVVREVMRREFSGLDRVILCDPLDYPDFVWAMNRSTLILSDSGGVQEEASALKKPVLILREVTERPEAVDQGSCLLVGTETERIVCEGKKLLDDSEAYEELQKRSLSPFGDGQASKRIRNVLVEDFWGKTIPLNGAVS